MVRYLFEKTFHEKTKLKRKKISYRGLARGNYIVTNFTVFGICWS